MLIEIRIPSIGRVIIGEFGRLILVPTNENNDATSR